MDVQDDSSVSFVLLGLVLLVATTYLFISQQPTAVRDRHPAQNDYRLMPGRFQTTEHATLPAKLIDTNGLNDSQLSLHRSLPSRMGTRAITICLETLVKADGECEWASTDTPQMIADLVCVADVYLLASVSGMDEKQTQEHMQKLRSFVTNDPLLKPSSPTGLPPQRILFCTTSIGRIAFVRQIEPQVHVEVEEETALALDKHVSRVVHVTSAAPADMALMKRHVTESATEYFKLLSAVGRG